MLNEGIHVTDVDGVILFRPTEAHLKRVGNEGI